MRFLIVDESAEFRRTVSDMLRERWPDAQMEHWDPGQRGSPAAALAGGRYSAVLLDSHPAGEDGIGWAAQIHGLPQAPPVGLLADHGDTHVAIQAMKTGAGDFLRKTGLASARLARPLEDAMREHEVPRRERSGEDSPFAPTMPIR